MGMKPEFTVSRDLLKIFQVFKMFCIANIVYDTVVDATQKLLSKFLSFSFLTFYSFNGSFSNLVLRLIFFILVNYF